MFKLTEGGLVVYGSFIGAVIGIAIFVIRRKLHLLAILDIIAPSLMVGLCIGRIGCLLNGCCYGGVCPPDNPFASVALTFPAEDPPGTKYPLRPTDSPPYADQRAQGLLYGITFADTEPSETGIANQVVVSAIDSRIFVNGAEIPLEAEVIAVNGERITSAKEATEALQFHDHRTIQVSTADGQVYRWSLPRRSLPVFPTQVFSSVNAALLAIFLWFYYPYRRRDGEVFALLLTAYPIARFLIERIRNDVGGYFGTQLTISQWVSIILLASAVVFWAYLLLFRPKGSVLPPAAD